MLWLRQMAFALLTLILVSVAVGAAVATVQAVTGPIEPPRGVLGGVLSVTVLGVLLLVARRISVAIDRRDAVRTGLPRQS